MGCQQVQPRGTRFTPTTIATNDYADKHRSAYTYDIALDYDFDYDCRYNHNSCNDYNDDYDCSNHRKRDSGA